MNGKLTLSDGTVFLGKSFGAPIQSGGEVVFNTGMMGYPESLTDPSYFGQILVLTYPLVGNYGVPDPKFFESDKIQVKGLIVQNYIPNPSHFESQKTLSQWLKEEGIPALEGIDTRALTIKLRDHGVMLGKIELPTTDYKLPTNIYDPNSENVLPFVSIGGVQEIGEGKKRVVVIDCGTKRNIINSLVKRHIKVLRVPWNCNPLKDPAVGAFDAVLISNGPGDPAKAIETIQTVKELMKKNIPTFGICLGSQIMCLATGGKTYKLKFGHRGQNQPVINVLSKKAIITSQNHGFAVDMKTMDKNWEEWFVNLNDGTNEGIKHKTKPFMAVQFHPEFTPGPKDADYLFDEFLSFIK